MPPSTLLDRVAEKKVLLGCCIDSCLASHGELAALMGYDVAWGELEHGSATTQDALHFCQGVQAGGGLAALRIPDASRDQVLHALDVGADMVVVPMVEDADTARQVVRHGKYAPLGRRGYNSSTRGLGYGLGGQIKNMARANQRTHLLVQIETVQAVEHCEQIVAVEGIAGVVLGPGDLSVSMDRPLAFGDPQLLAAVRQVFRIASAKGKLAMMVSGHPALVEASLAEGAQILVTTGERLGLKAHWGQNLKDMHQKIQGAGASITPA